MPFDFKKLKDIMLTWNSKIDQGGGLQALFWNNHDQPWALNRFGDTGKYHNKSAEMLALTLHLLRGTPYIYMGEEIGMMDPHYTSMEDYVDVEALNAYDALIKKGISEKEAFEIVQSKARDNSRVPMHWDSSKYAGFSTHKPWLMPTDQEKINVEKELHDGEIFSFYQKLIKLRKTEKLISEGHIKPFLMEHPQVMAYERYLDDSNEKILVFANFYGKDTEVKVPVSYLNKAGQILIQNYDENLVSLPSLLQLKPYEALAIKF